MDGLTFLARNGTVRGPSLIFEPVHTVTGTHLRANLGMQSSHKCDGHPLAESAFHAMRLFLRILMTNCSLETHTTNTTMNGRRVSNLEVDICNSYTLVQYQQTHHFSPHTTHYTPHT